MKKLKHPKESLQIERMWNFTDYFSRDNLSEVAERMNALADKKMEELEEEKRVRRREIIMQSQIHSKAQRFLLNLGTKKQKKQPKNTAQKQAEVSMHQKRLSTLKNKLVEQKKVRSELLKKKEQAHVEKTRHGSYVSVQKIEVGTFDSLGDAREEAAQEIKNISYHFIY